MTQLLGFVGLQLKSYLSKNWRIRSSNCSEAKHNSFSTSVISIPACTAGIQLTNGIRLTIAEIKLKAHMLLRKSFGSIPGRTSLKRGRMLVGAEGRQPPAEARGRATEVMHINVAVT